MRNGLLFRFFVMAVVDAVLFVLQVYNEGDMIWVHGFHLLLLPSFLTRVLRTARVGLFLHTPFPSSEIFRTLPFREDLLRGMLNADQVCMCRESRVSCG